MPVVYNTLVNDPLVFDGTTDFFGGMNDANKATLIAANATQGMTNVEIVDTGKARTRLFTDHYGNVAAQEINGLCFFKKPATPEDTTNGIPATPEVNTLVAACAGQLYQCAQNIDGDYIWTVIAGYTYDTLKSPRVTFIQANNKLIVSDGVQNQHVWDGTTLSSYTAGDANTAAAITPPKCSYLSWHTNRMFAAGNSAAPDTVYCSKILHPEAYSDVDSMTIGSGDGDAITGIAPWKGHDFIVCKRFSTWLVEADPQQALLSRWKISKLTPNVGCVAHATLAALGDDLVFLSQDGVAKVSFYVGDETRGVSTMLSDPIRPLVKRINWPYAHLSTATVWRNKYLLSVPLDNAITPDSVLVYDATHGCWSGVWTGINATVFCRSFLNDQYRLCFGDTSGNVRYFDETGTATTYDRLPSGDQDVATEIITRGYNFSEILSPKTGDIVNLEFHNSQATATLTARVNEDDVGGVLWSGTTTATSASFPLTDGDTLYVRATLKVTANIQPLGQFDDIAFHIQSSAGLLCLRSVIVTGWIDTINTAR